MLTALKALTSYEANDIVTEDPSEDCRNDTTRRQKEERDTCLARSFLSEVALCWNSRRVSNDGNPTCRALREELKDTLDDEMKLAGLEALVPEELEKYLILNSNRLRTFEDARLEIVTYGEAKFGLRIRHPKPSGKGTRGHYDSMDVDAINSLASGTGTEKGHQDHEMVVSSAVELMFRDCNVHVTPRNGNGKKGKQSKSWSRSARRGNGKEGKGDVKLQRYIHRFQECQRFVHGWDVDDWLFLS